MLCDPHRALVTGPTKLHGKTIISPDIRAGMAFVLAGLIASDTTTIEHADLIERGYEKIDERLKLLGAQIERIEV
jgi:UDP-N-acetylglucosamine 1-carboxyvinyltransferase